MRITTTSITKILLVLFLLISGLYFAKSFLIPLFIGGVFATLFLPVCKWLEKKNISRGLSAFACLLIMLSVVAVIGTLLGWQISEFAKDIDLIHQKSNEAIKNVQDFVFANLGLSVEEQTEIIKSEKPSVAGVFQVVVASLTEVVTNFILVMAYIFLFLYYRNHIRQFILKLTAPSQRSEMDEVIFSVSHVSQQYLVGLAKMIVCLWIMYGIGFSLLGVHNAFFYAILCGLLEIIPFIGNLTGTTITVLVAAVHGSSPAVLGGIILTYGIVQFIQGWVLEPFILGHEVKINPLITIVALVFGSLIWGIPGIFLALPLTAMFKIVCDHIESLKPIGFLIGQVGSKKAK